MAGCFAGDAAQSCRRPGARVLHLARHMRAVGAVDEFFPGRGADAAHVAIPTPAQAGCGGDALISQLQRVKSKIGGIDSRSPQQTLDSRHRRTQQPSWTGRGSLAHAPRSVMETTSGCRSGDSFLPPPLALRIPARLAAGVGRMLSRRRWSFAAATRCVSADRGAAQGLKVYEHRRPLRLLIQTPALRPYGRRVGRLVGQELGQRWAPQASSSTIASAVRQ